MPEDATLGLRSNAQNNGTTFGQLDQVGVVELTAIQLSNRVDRYSLTKSSFAHGLHVFKRNGLLERLRVPMNDRILHSERFLSTSFLFEYTALLLDFQRDPSSFINQSSFIGQSGLCMVQL